MNMHPRSMILLTLALAACASPPQPLFTEHANPWIGQPLESRIAFDKRPDSYASRSGWKDTRYQLENGNAIYASPESEGCIVHWEVDPKGIIVGYRSEGGQCK
jgi:hypothetical protein